MSGRVEECYKAQKENKLAEKELRKDLKLL